MRLGQHFLVNKKKFRKIIEALDLKPGDTVVEIGPGHGELALLLARNFQFPISNFQIIAIEKDSKLVKDLKSKIQNLGIKNIKITEGDALTILPKLTQSSKLITHNYKLVGNIPYYITGHLLRIIGELKNKPVLIIFTIQKEVAERVYAKPGQMNLLAASVQFWAEPKVIGRISQKDFRPVPKVDSAIIKLSPRIYADNKRIDADRYYRLIRILFKQPRKTILNNLVASRQYQVSGIKNREGIIDKLKKLDINPQDRPQDLNIEQIRQLSTLFRGLL